VVPEVQVFQAKAGWIAAVIAGVTAIVYLVLIVRQAEGEVSSVEVGLVFLVFALILGAAVAAVVGGSTPDLRMKSLLLGAASGELLSLGYLSLFSIGLLLLIAGIVSTIAWVRAMAVGGTGARGWSVLAFIGAAALPWVLLLLQES
jgi:hypothetical protein